MGHVADILATKGSQVHSVPRHASVHDAVTRMVQSNIGSVVVMDGATPVGIFTERDCLHRVALGRGDSRSTAVGDVMNEQLQFVEGQMPIHECMTIMTQSRIRHLLVRDGDRVIGLISIGDVVKQLSREQEGEILQLTRYITGTT